MNVNDVFQLVLFIISLLALTPLLGSYMAVVYDADGKHFLKRPLYWCESLIYKFSGVNPDLSCNWKLYAVQVLLFNALGFLFLFFLQIFQANLILNPNHLANIKLDLAFNTAASFVTNTNWQAYAGETTISYLTSILGLTVQNFLSAATGMAVLLVLLRGIRNQLKTDFGNFWVDLTRSVVYILLPLSLIFSIFLVSQGVIQNYAASKEIFPSGMLAETEVSQQYQNQVIPMGPAASQIAIKQLGTNGGGFFNTNSAHPLENPTPLSNFFQMLTILLIPFATVYMSGIMLKSRRQALVILLAMLFLFSFSLAGALYSEYLFANKALILEGKELRFGIFNSVLWSIATTAASNGSVNSMISSLSPLASGLACFNIMLGEVVFGGVGCGLYGMFMFIFLTVFLVGLMVGRTPEFMGKKIEAKEMICVMLAMLIPNILILIGSAFALSSNQGLSSILSQGPHGLMEVLYALSSAAGNNGSAFAGLNANTPFYNFLLGVVMLIARFSVMIPVLVIADSLAKKKIVPASSGTFPTDSMLFVILLIAVILIVGGLTFLPSLVLAPIAEQILVLRGMVF